MGATSKYQGMTQLPQTGAIWLPWPRKARAESDLAVVEVVIDFDDAVVAVAGFRRRTPLKLLPCAGPVSASAGQSVFNSAPVAEFTPTRYCCINASACD